MKAHAGLYAPRGGTIFRGGPRTFFHSGANGRWHAAPTADECRLYEQTAARRLGSACARWLAKGAGARFQPKPESPRMDITT
jgi:aryl sulfotransferase